MQGTHAGDISNLFFPGKYSHCHTSVDFTLGRTGLMDGADDPPVISRPEKRAGIGMGTGKLSIVKKIPFIFIDDCLKESIC